MKITNSQLPTPEQISATLTSGEPGPVTMVNLLKFKAHATYANGENISGAEAYGRYSEGVIPLLKKAGGRLIYAGAVNRLMIGVADDLWDAVAIAEYPSREAFAGMVMSAEYQAIAHHRLAGLEGQLNIDTKPRA